MLDIDTIEYDDKFLMKDQKEFMVECMEKIHDKLDEQSLEGAGLLFSIESESRSGFISFTDGGLILDYKIFTRHIHGSGYFIPCIENYINHVENLAIEFANETTTKEENEELYNELFDHYMDDDYINIRVQIMFYDSENEGNGTNKIYITTGLTDEYGRFIDDERFKTGLKDAQKEIKFEDIKEFNNHCEELTAFIIKKLEI